jgi:ligand-binding SRPBCC domain-containing protein
VRRRLVLERTTQIHASLPEVFQFFSAPANLGTITPPKLRFRIVAAPSRRLREDDRIEYRIRIFGVLPAGWTTRICMWRENEAFADVQERGPYRFWLHTHTFRDTPDGVEMHDRVEYELPFGWLGRLFGGWLVSHELRAIFDYREAVIRRVFA